MSAGGCLAKFPSTVTESSCAVDTPWSRPHEYFAPIRDAMRARYALFPYLYNLAREAHDTGLSPLRPMYHEFPTNDMAYAMAPNGSFAQYMLGSDILVSPIVGPGKNTPQSMLARKDVWIPPGCWVERTTGWRVCGPGIESDLGFALEQIPVFVRAGRAIACNALEDKQGRPLTDLIGGVSRNRTMVQFDIYHGVKKVSTEQHHLESGGGYAYDDDGETLAYMTSATHAVTSNVSMTYQWSSATTMELEVDMVRPTHLATQAFTVRLVLLDTFPAAKVVVGPNDDVTFDWGYNARAMGVQVDIEFPCAPPVEPSVKSSDQDNTFQHASAKVVINWHSGRNERGSRAVDVQGVRGAIANARLAKHAFDLVRRAPVEKKLVMSPLARLASLTVLLERLSSTERVDKQERSEILGFGIGIGLEALEEFVKVVGEVSDLLRGAIKEVSSVPQRSDDDKRRSAYALELLREAERKMTLGAGYGDVVTSGAESALE
jgi:hypothetical protein